MLVEVLVDSVDEDRQRRVERTQARHQMAIGVGGAALELARRGEVTLSQDEPFGDIRISRQ